MVGLMPTYWNKGLLLKSSIIGETNRFESQIFRTKKWEQTEKNWKKKSQKKVYQWSLVEITFKSLISLIEEELLAAKLKGSILGWVVQSKVRAVCKRRRARFWMKWQREISYWRANFKVEDLDKILARKKLKSGTRSLLLLKDSFESLFDAISRGEREILPIGT